MTHWPEDQTLMRFVTCYGALASSGEVAQR